MRGTLSTALAATDGSRSLSKPLFEPE